jgi:tetraacyldisaccharide 4'-kinase
MPVLPTPAFWFEKPTIAAKLLKPFGWLYGQIAQALHSLKKSEKISIPVICVGNAVAGGAGKTPLTAAIATMLRAAGHNPHILSRGYGGTMLGPVQVDPTQHSVGDVGDEPLVLAKTAPVWVAKNKRAGALAAVNTGADVLILDDGLQNPSLVKNLSLLVVDGTQGIGNGFLIPAGPLRENYADALAKSNAAVWINDGHGALRKETEKSLTVLKAQARTVCLTHDIIGKPVFAFCGLARGEKFYTGLRAAGADVKGTCNFPDHYMWSTFEMDHLMAAAEALGALPITTSKDAVRLPESFLVRVAVCDVALSFEDEAAFKTLLQGVFSRK